MDIFPYTTEKTKTAVDQVGRTAWQMTYFLSSRATQLRTFGNGYIHRQRIALCCLSPHSLHDIGKVHTAKAKEGRLVFYGHAKQS